MGGGNDRVFRRVLRADFKGGVMLYAECYSEYALLYYKNTYIGVVDNWNWRELISRGYFLLFK
jgi:hypothetical protein